MPEAVKQSRVDDAYSRLKDEIRNNRMAPGFQATEPEVALHLGMSRTPVREALIRLAAEGLVELIPRRGVRVLPIRADDMREIYDILTALEPDAAARLAARAPTAEQLAPLDEATRRMEAALEADDLDAWTVADDMFHLALLDLQGNRRLKDIVTALYDQTHRTRSVTLRLRGAPHQSTAEHREILHHLARADPDATRDAFKRHRQRAAEELLGILEKYKLAQL
ncbi:GntR family transcriptional regulator [Oceaniglobus indicus]|uniref:GntR family transcriptional regulator n=1 Tax=Oceaniglobus indicus TaxID=2047749 RepID=UPI000C17EEFE|nr:GntR family transcriptional regulator [Oceaniglobus indicus]